MTVPQVAQAVVLNLLIDMMCGIPAYFAIPFPQVAIPLLWTSWGLQILIPHLTILVKRYFIGKPFGVITNLEHHVERMSLFTFIILGEILCAIIWSSYRKDFTEAEIVTLCGIVIAICIHHIYHVGSGVEYGHAIQKGTWTGMAWQILHLPLHLCLILVGACMSMNVKKEKVLKNARSLLKRADYGDFGEMNDTIQTIFVISMGLVLSIMILISALHRQSKEFKYLVPFRTNLLVRSLVAIVFFVFSAFVSIWSGSELMKISCVIWVLLMLFTMLGMQLIGKVTLNRTSAHFVLSKR